MESVWCQLRDITYKCSAEVLGFVKRKHQDWFDENDADAQTLLDNMHSTHLAWINDKASATKKNAYHQARNDAQRNLRRMKESWWAQKASELQEAADCNQTKRFFDGLKAVYGPRTSGTMPLR